MSAQLEGRAVTAGEGAGRLAQVLRVAKSDVVALALLAAAHLAAGVVVGWIAARHIAVLQRTADLSARLRGAGDVDAKLALIESQVAAQDAQVAALRRRMPPDLRPAAISDRVEFRAKELNLSLSSEVSADGERESFPVDKSTTVSLKRFERIVDAKGGFREVATLLADMESWEELVAVRSLSIRRSGKGSEALVRFDMSVFRLDEPGRGGGP
jgi:hypothetical protein